MKLYMTRQPFALSTLNRTVQKIHGNITRFLYFIIFIVLNVLLWLLVQSNIPIYY